MGTIFLTEPGFQLNPYKLVVTMMIGNNHGHEKRGKYTHSLFASSRPCCYRKPKHPKRSHILIPSPTKLKQDCSSWSVQCALSIQCQTVKRSHLSVYAFSDWFTWFGSELLTARAGAAGPSIPPDVAAPSLGVVAAASETSQCAANLACECVFYSPDWKLTRGNTN